MSWSSRFALLFLFSVCVGVGAPIGAAFGVMQALYSASVIATLSLLCAVYARNRELAAAARWRQLGELPCPVCRAQPGDPCDPGLHG